MEIELSRWNIELFYLINHARSAYLDYFFSYFYLLGKGYILIPLLFIVYRFYRDRLKLFVGAVLVESLVVQALKWYFKAPRPAKLLPDVYLIESVYHKSFPSGDTAMAFVIACFFSEVLPRRWRFLPWVYAFLVAYGRIYVGAHFPLDVFVGALIGVGSYLVVKGILALFDFRS